MRRYIDQQPGTEWRYWEGGAHFQAWYPVHVAADLEPGMIVGRKFLGSKIIIYRDPEGKAVAQSAYCPHLGADLSGGEICEGQVRCPYHHWSYDKDGACTKVASGTRPPRVARLRNYPVAEKWGIIWVFNGEEPLYEVPGFRGNEEDYIFKAREREEVIETDSWIQGSNGLDFQHLTAVHHMPESMKPETVTYGDYTIEYDLKGFSPNGWNKMFAGNCLASHETVPVPGAHVLFITNAPEPGMAESFWVAAVKKADFETQEQAEARVDELDKFLFGFFDEDEYILRDIRFRLPGNAKLIKDDYHLAKYFEFLDKFPRAAPLE